MRLTVRMVFKWFADFEIEGVPNEAGIAAEVRPACLQDVGHLASIELHRRGNFTEVARRPKFHTTVFEGGLGILMRSRFPELRQKTGEGRIPASYSTARRYCP